MIFPPTRFIRRTITGVSMRTAVLGEGNDGNNPAFVLVHGLGMSSRYMMPTGRLLAAHGKVFVPELPGFGSSGKPPQALSISGLADALAEWMDVMGIQAGVLIGNSLGAQVIGDFAVRYPHRLAGAVLVGPTIDAEGRCFFTQMSRLLLDIPREPWRLMKIGFTDYFRMGFMRFLRTLDHALKDPVVKKLPLIHCPVLVVRGSLDPIVPQEWAEQVVSLLPAGRLVTLVGAAHAANFSHPEDLVREVLAFTSSPGTPSRVWVGR